MKKTAKAMALLTAASMIMSAFTPVYAASTDTDETAAVDWENGDNIKAIKEKGVITVATGTYDALWKKWIDASGEGEEAAEEATAAEDAKTAE